MVTYTPEQLVLSRLLFGMAHEQRYLCEHLEPYHFPDREYGALFARLAQMQPDGLDPVAARAQLKALDARLLGRFDQLLAISAPEQTTAPGLAKGLKAYNTTSRLERAVTTALDSIHRGVAYDDVRAALEGSLAAIDSAAVDGKAFDDKKAMAARVLESFSEQAGGLPFGYARMDDRVTPILRGNLVIVAGRPGTGKSTDLRNWAMNWVQADEPTAYFSFEMTGDEKLPHFACMRSGVSYEKVIRNQLTTEEAERFGTALQWWVDADHFILNDRASVTPAWLIKQLLRYRAMGVTTFILDHLHRVRYTQNAKGDIRLAMAEFVRDLKSFAVDTQSRIICGAQLTKGDKHEEPGDELIREAGQLIDEADKIFLKWLPLVVGTRDAFGIFHPTTDDQDRRTFAKGAPPGSVVGLDVSRTYLKIGKQRVRTTDGFIVLPFIQATGRIPQSR